MLLKSQVKYIQSLGQKKFRDEEAVFIAEGPKIVNELLHSEATPLLSLYGVREWIDEHHQLVSSLSSSNLVEVNQSELKRISELSTPNQVLGLFRKPASKEIKLEGQVSLLLDDIQDPGNLGTIIRTADWFGLSNIFCSLNSADAFNPKVVQSTMGSISRVQVIYQDLHALLDHYGNMPVYSTSLEGHDVFKMKPLQEGFIIIGNESKGVSSALLTKANHQISIPRKGAAESLNAAVAVGIILSRLVKIG